MDRATLRALLLKPPGTYLGDLLAQGLAAAGVPVVTVGTPYDVVIEAERSGGAFSHIFLRVDYFGRDEFRLLPLLRREWPEAILVAYHSSGFEHKGLLADLMGADAVLATESDAARVLETLYVTPGGNGERDAGARVEAAVQAATPTVSGPPPAAAGAASLAVTLQAALAQGEPEIPAAARAEVRSPAPAGKAAAMDGEPADSAAATADLSPPGPPAGPQAASTGTERPVELTEEELRMLLGQEDDA